MTTSPQTETIRQWDPFTGEWRGVTVPVTAMPERRPARTRKASRHHGAPRDLTGLSDAAPLPPWWRDTAFAPREPLADTRTWVKPPAMRTRRVPPVMPAKDLGEITDTSRRR